MIKVSERIQKAVEIAAFLFLYFNTLWNLYYFEKSSYAVFLSIFLMLAIFAYSILKHWEGLRAWGIRFDNFTEAFQKALPILTAIVAACFVIAMIKKVPFNFPTFKLFYEYPLAGLLQQLLFQGFFYNRYEAVTKNRFFSILLSALTFALFHLPNKPLTAVTFVAGLYLSYIFARHRNLFVVALLHGWISLCITFTLEPAGIIKSFKVGPQPLAVMKKLTLESLTPDTRIVKFVPSQGIPASFSEGFGRQVRDVQKVEEINEYLNRPEPVFLVIEEETFMSMKPSLTAPQYIWMNSLAWLRKFPHRRSKTLKCVLTFNYRQLHDYYRRKVLLISNRPRV